MKINALTPLLALVAVASATDGPFFQQRSDTQQRSDIFRQTPQTFKQRSDTPLHHPWDCRGHVPAMTVEAGGGSPEVGRVVLLVFGAAGLFALGLL